MVLEAKLPGFADKFDVFTGAVGVDLPKQSLKALH
jgi:hypothetical protein